MWIDAHNHLQDERFGVPVDDLVASMRAAGVEACVANGTGPGDWDRVAALAARFPGFVVPSFGLHPWRVAEARAGWRDELARWWDSIPGAGAGEIGLDLWIPDPQLDRQLDAFRWQWRQAAERDLPATVHCLRAWGPMLGELRALPARPGRVLIHGFAGSAEVAADLVNHGCYLGFGGSVLHGRKARAREVFASLPGDRILLETDAPDMAGPEEARPFRLPDPAMNHPANLAANGEALAALRGVAPGALAADLRARTLAWLGRR